MGAIYRDDLVEVRSGWLGWRVINRLTGARVIPPTIAQERMGFAWPKICKLKTVTPKEREWGQKVLCQSFGIAAIEPNGEMGAMFAALEPDELVEVAINEGRARASLFGSATHNPAPSTAWDRRDEWERSGFKRYDVKAAGILWLRPETREALAAANDDMLPIAIKEGDVRKFWQVHEAILDDPRNVGCSPEIIAILRELFLKVGLNHRREKEYFQTEDAADIARRLRITLDGRAPDKL